MVGIPKHKAEGWREKAKKIIDIRKKIKLREIELAKKRAKETGVITSKAIGDPKSNTPVIGSKDFPWDSKTGKVLAPDLGPKGTVILNKDGTYTPIVEAKEGAIIIGKNVDKDLL